MLFVQNRKRFIDGIVPQNEDGKTVAAGLKESHN